ncbi:MAG: 30S ribosomal protein S3 [Chloroflexota bacterium]
MGRKVHPYGFRLKIIRDWQARWYAGGKDYADQLGEDLKIRKLIHQSLARAGVSLIEIERFPNQVSITVHTAKPGIVIGRRGATVKDLRKELEDLTGKRIRLEVAEVDKPDLDAYLVAENIAQQLERRISHSRAMRRAAQQAMRFGAEGIKILCSGRLAGAEMARREWIREGQVPLQTLRADIDFARAEALTTYGRIGIKVWIYKGEVLPKAEAATV